MEFIGVTDCSNCPCLSRCRDENNCNLNYNVDLLWKKDKELVYCSTECKLESVTFENKVFKQDKTTATKIRPENWR